MIIKILFSSMRDNVYNLHIYLLMILYPIAANVGRIYNYSKILNKQPKQRGISSVSHLHSPSEELRHLSKTCIDKLHVFYNKKPLILDSDISLPTSALEMAPQTLTRHMMSKTKSQDQSKKRAPPSTRFFQQQTRRPQHNRNQATTTEKQY